MFHSDVWLEKKFKNRFFLLDYIECFLMKKKNKPCAQLNDVKLLWDLAILIELSHHLNLLSLILQEKEKLVSILFGTLKTFQNKFSLFLNQIEKFDFFHFECCAI